MMDGNTFSPQPIKMSEEPKKPGCSEITFLLTSDSAL
jgi:hypothetical protein